MQEKKTQAGYNATIPAFVRYDKELTMGARMLYGEITALCNKEGYCWATNSYFADLYEVSIDTVSRWVTSLEKKGYIKRDVVYKENSKEVKERRIYLPEARFNIQKEKKEKKEQPQSPTNQTEKTQFEKLYERYVDLLNPEAKEYIYEVENVLKVDIELYIEALRRAKKNNARHINYIKAILQSWARDGIYTMAQYKIKNYKQKEMRENDNTTRRNDKKDNGNAETNGDGVFRGEFELTEEERRICEEAKGMFEGIEDYI